MLSTLRRVLPVLAAGGAMVGVLCLWLAHQQRRTLLAETGDTLPAAQAVMARLQAFQPVSIDSDEFRRAIEQTTHEPHVATVWLFEPGGRLVYSAGSMSESTPQGRTVAELATEDVRRLLAALPEGELSQDRRTWLLAVSAMRREGTHNDIYRHLLWPIRSANGQTVALVGVAYDVSSATPSLADKCALLVGLAGLFVYWLALPAWVWLDSRDRGERAWAWTAFLVIGNLVALLAYILARNYGDGALSSS